jgi:tetratricopeptide (TPR) repeat protein
MRRTLLSIVLFVAVALLGSAHAQTVLIHPFLSDGSLLGSVVADRVAGALDGQADLVVGPAAAPAVVPPFPYADGFVNPLAVLEPGGVARLHGAALLRAGTGVDLAVSGRVSADADGLRLDLVAAGKDGSTLATTLRAAEDAPHELARRAAVLIAGRLGLGLPADPAPIDMAGADDALGRVLTLLAGGLVDDAQDLLDEAAANGLRSPRLAQLQAVLDAVASGRPVAGSPVLAAIVALSSLQDDARTLAYMEGMAGAGVPAADVWIGAIAAGGGDLARADDAFARARGAYPYGGAAHAAHQQAQARDGAADAVAALAGSDDPATLVVAALLNELASDFDAERRALEALARATPTFAWPFERLSFQAFDAGDALAAARALAVAVELQPESDLYWTNLGWAWYLLGFWDRSEAASVRALELDAGAYIAAYNLGLVRARFGRLDEAMPPYERALAADPEVDDEALADVENAIAERPEEASLHYVLGRLYEQEGRRDEAAAAYRAFLDLGGFGAPYDAAAEERYAALTAPPPPLEIGGGRLDLTLAGETIDGPLRPGDPIGLRFEVYTPGDALPGRVLARATLRDAAGATVAEAERRVDVPTGAIGYVVEELGIELPDTAAAGDYRLSLEVEGDGDTRAGIERSVEVAGDPDPLRRLLGRGVELTALATGRPLIDVDDVLRGGSVLPALIGELRAAASAAETSLPVAEEGRFAGLSGGVLFESSDERDVRDFLAFLVREGLSDVRLTFVDAYAQWALDGAP